MSLITGSILERGEVRDVAHESGLDNMVWKVSLPPTFYTLRDLIPFYVESALSTFYMAP